MYNYKIPKFSDWAIYRRDEIGLKEAESSGLNELYRTSTENKMESFIGEL